MTSDVLGSKSATQNPPSVTIQYPTGGEDLSGDKVTLEWTASDPDGDSLSYTVKYSRDGGSTWKALSRRIPDRGTMKQRTSAWQKQRNAADATVDWQFRAEEARINLKRLYPKIDD